MGSFHLKLCEKSGQTERGASARAWPGSLHGNSSRRAHRKGVVTLPRQGVSSIGGPHPLRRSYGILPVESHVLCTLQKGCGNPDRAPSITCSHTGLGLQGVPGGSSENTCVSCDQVDNLLSLVAEL